jgi:hypothetical protein
VLAAGTPGPQDQPFRFASKAVVISVSWLRSEDGYAIGGSDRSRKNQSSTG